MGKNSGIILQINRLEIARGDNTLLSGLDFAMQAGEAVWVTGANGIGKTSLLKAICGLLRPKSGQVLWQGQPIEKHENGQIGFAGHNDSHKPNLSVLENLQFWQKIYQARQDINNILSKTALAEKSGVRAKSLSAGQSRRLALARLILQNARLWVLDEPMASMDKKGQMLIENLLQDHCKNGGLAIIASHTKPKKIGNNTRILHIDGQD